MNSTRRDDFQRVSYRRMLDNTPTVTRRKLPEYKNDCVTSIGGQRWRDLRGSVWRQSANNNKLQSCISIQTGLTRGHVTSCSLRRVIIVTKFVHSTVLFEFSASMSRVPEAVKLIHAVRVLSLRSDTLCEVTSEHRSRRRRSLVRNNPTWRMFANRIFVFARTYVYMRDSVGNVELWDGRASWLVIERVSCISWSCFSIRSRVDPAIECTRQPNSLYNHRVSSGLSNKVTDDKCFAFMRTICVIWVNSE